MSLPKISILVMTYNQEATIGEALDSAINQITCPYEVIVSDDCSTDGTWDVIRGRAASEGEILKIHRNKRNLGIYGNYEFLKSQCTGDIVCLLAGDDKFKPHLTTVISDCFRENSINPSSKFIIVTNNRLCYPDGRSRLWDNYSERHRNHFSMRLRNGLSYRSIGMSTSLLRDCDSTTALSRRYPDLGYMVDMLKGLQEVERAESVYFCDEVVCDYNVDVGVTAKKNPKEARQILDSIGIIREIYRHTLTNNDKKYLSMIEALTRFSESKSPLLFANSFFLWLLNINNCSKNTPWIFHLKFLIPAEYKMRIKKSILPVLLKKTTDE